MDASFSSTPMPAGTLIGPYAIMELIARGGMSTVYRARHTTLQDEVALKILYASPGDDELPARFLREGQAMARLRHPNIVQIYNADTFNNLQYLAMEYAPNGTLKKLLSYAKWLPVEQALMIAQQMAEALDYAHARGVIHRDIKPSNILCVDEQRFVLADFGIADDKTSSKITRTRSTMGTLEYMSPEQAQGQVADGRSDVYSLGIVLYEMLTGKPPFEAENMMALIYKHTKETPITITKLRPEVPPAVAAIVAKAIAKNPKDRFQSAGEMATAISALLGISPSPRRAMPPLLLIGGIALTVLLAAAVGAFALLRGNGPSSAISTLAPTNGTPSLATRSSIVAVATIPTASPSPKTIATPTTISTAIATVMATPTDTATPLATATPQPSATLPPTSVVSLEGMVKIKAGTYTLGRDLADGLHVAPTQVNIASYWIDVYQVTNAEYQTFLSDVITRATPSTWPGRAKHPARGVTWSDAAAYCQLHHKRLPSEAEWEFAARGSAESTQTDLPNYPWGNDPLAAGQTDSLPRDDTYEVGTHAFNRSGFGVFDLDGNVLEWVDQPYAPIPIGPQNKILRGGRFGFLQDMAHRHFAEDNDKTYGPYAGFRCAASASN